MSHIIFGNDLFFIPVYSKLKCNKNFHDVKAKHSPLLVCQIAYTVNKRRDNATNCKFDTLCNLGLVIRVASLKHTLYLSIMTMFYDLYASFNWHYQVSNQLGQM